MTGWETSERVLESGGFESRQRVLVAEPTVEASEAGARTGASAWTGMLYAKGQSPFHAAVSRRYFELLLRNRHS